MNFDIKYLKSGVTRVIVVHAISIIITGILTFLVPKSLDNFNYGLWQLYIFYFGYIGFFHLGWVDGLYLNYLGKHYNDLNKSLLKNEAILFFIFQLVVTVAVFILSYFIEDQYKSIIIKCLSLILVITNFRFYFIYLLQACGRVKEYSNIQIYERILLVIIFVFLLFKRKDFYSIIYADIFSKLLTLLLAIYYCRDIFLLRANDFKKSIIDSAKNINDGSKLMLANIISMLTTGVIKFAIENKFGIVAFGEICLAITFSNLCINILNSLGIVYMPMIKTQSLDISKKVYYNLHLIIDTFVFFSMIFYYPLKNIALYFLPNYANSFIYLSLTFPILYFCCLQALLLVTFLKAYRCEKILMYINLIVLLFSIVYSFIGVSILKSIEFCAIGMTLVYFIKISLYELAILKYVNIPNCTKFIFDSLVMCGAFCLINYFIHSILSLFLYIIVFILYAILNLSSIKKAVLILSSFKDK